MASGRLSPERPVHTSVSPLPGNSDVSVSRYGGFCVLDLADCDMCIKEISCAVLYRIFNNWCIYVIFTSGRFVHALAFKAQFLEDYHSRANAGSTGK